MAASTVTISITYILMVVGLFSRFCNGGFIGMNWGRQSAQRLLPSQVVDLLLQNGIKNLRIFTSQPDILKAFAGSNISLAITIFDPTFPVDKSARNWYQSRADLMSAANVSTVIVGGEYMFTRPPPVIDRALKALRGVQEVFEEVGRGDEIKANMIHQSVELTTAVRPSETEFRPEIKGRMIEFVEFLRKHDAPFLLDMFPIADMDRCDLDMSFAFADNSSGQVIRDVNGAVYRNVLEWQYDSFLWALKKINASDVRIVVSQIGWPTDGYRGASVANAERFYKYLLPWVGGNKGTPMRPGMPIDVYVHALTDEPKMTYANAFMRHWGIYRSNGEPKYKIDLSGQGRDIFPTTVKGIMRMPNRWCIFNGDRTDMEEVKKQVEIACGKGDCTSLVKGASCSHLSVEKNISYAFNSYFQTFFQDEKACNFSGFAHVTDDDPSNSECLFPVEVVRGEQLIDFVSAAGEGRPNCAVLVLMISLLWGLILS